MAVRSLGRLTLDLVAQVGGFIQGMNQAQRSAQQTTQNVTNNMQRMRAGIVGALSGIAVGALLQKSFEELDKFIEKAAEIEKISNIANIDTTSLQEIGYVAKQAGIDLNGLAPILKDIQKNIGEFKTLDSGPVKDFVDNFGLLNNITADSFKDLDGFESLKLIFDNLVASGADMNQIVKVMDDVAGGSNELIPIFQKSQEEINELRNKYKELGGVMSEESILAAKELKTQMEDLDITTEGFKNTIAEQLIPYLSSLSNEFTGRAEDGKKLSGAMDLASFAADTLEAGINLLVGSLIVLSAPIKLIINQLGALAGVAAVAKQAMSLNWSGTIDELKNLANNYAAGVQDAMNTAVAGTERMFAEVGASRAKMHADLKKEAKERQENAQKELENAQKLAEANANLAKGKQEDERLKKVREESDKLLESEQRRLDLINVKTEKEKVLYEIEKGKYKEFTKERQQELLKIAEAIDLNKHQEESAKKAKSAATSGSNEAAKAAERQAEAERKVLEQFENQVFALEKRIALAGNDSEVASLKYDIDNGQLEQYTQQQKEQLLLLTEQAVLAEESAERQKKASEEIARAKEEEKNKIDDLYKSLEELNSQYDFERTLIGKTREEIELLTLARQYEAIASSEQYKQVEENLKRLQGEYDVANKKIELMDTTRDATKDALKSVFTEGASAAEAFMSVLDKVLDKMLDMSIDWLVDGAMGKGGSGGGWLDSLFSGFSGGGSGGGWLSSLFGGFRAGGGAVSPNKLYNVNESGFEMFSSGGKDYLLTGDQGGYITNNASLKNGLSNTIQQSNNFIINGKIDRRTQEQIAVKQGNLISRAQKRNL